MTVLNLEGIIEHCDEQDALARQRLLVHVRNPETDTCASCGRAWSCDTAIEAAKYVNHWLTERPRLQRRLYATAAAS